LGCITLKNLKKFDELHNELKLIAV